jgi:glyoxylase-like metal-dependent hydrolase (beta-lactamase superfamily II)
VRAPGGVGPDADQVLTPLARNVGHLDLLPPGIEPVPTPGHTPGHTCLLITDPDAEERLLILGDLLHTRAQFTATDWAFRSDVDAPLARQNRLGMLERFRDGHTVLAGGHFAGDVFGEAPA